MVSEARSGLVLTPHVWAECHTGGVVGEVLLHVIVDRMQEEQGEEGTLTSLSSQTSSRHTSSSF